MRQPATEEGLQNGYSFSGYKKICRPLTLIEYDLNYRFQTREQLAAQQRCYARVYKGIAAASVPFLGKGVSAA